MEHNNMTGDPNQKIPPPVFRFDPFPASDSIYSWETSNQQPKYPNPVTHIQNSQPIFPNFILPQVHSPVAPRVPASFSFGSHQPSTSDMGGQFPFQITTHELGDRCFKRVLGKRKTDSPPLQPFKQHITEEKMAEHMSKLHISSETAISPLEPESVKNKRLYMCDEMRKLQAESVIPSCLVSPIERPCTALVLWQPHAKILPMLGDQIDDSENNSENSNKSTTFDDTTLRNLEFVEMDSEFVGNMDMDA